MKNTIKIAAKNVTINQTINVSSIPEDISLRDLLDILGDVEKAGSKPTPKALRERKLEDGSVQKIAPLAEAMDGACKVYANGYAVYANGIGTTVLWLPDCRTFTYQFDELKDKEKEYLPQRSQIGEDVMDSQPWFMAVMLRGDHQVERNAMDRKSDRKGKNQKLSLDEITEKDEQEYEWRPGCRFENPEAAYIRKEMIQEQLAKLTEKQKEVFILYHKYGYSQQEIADILGVTQKAVDFRLKAAENKVRMSVMHF